MYDPENNMVKIKTLRKVLKNYPAVDVFIHDTNCKLAKEAEQKAYFSQIRYWAVDKFHGAKHGKSCRYSPQNNKDIADRLEGINTSVAEMVFSWLSSPEPHLGKTNILCSNLL